MTPGFIGGPEASSGIARNSRNLGEAICHDLARKGFSPLVVAFVEAIFDDPLDKAAAAAKATRHIHATQEVLAAALIEALVSARTHEGWLALMAGRGESETPLDVATDWCFEDLQIDAQARRIGVTMRVNRQHFRIWVSYAEALLLAQGLASRFARAELTDHPFGRRREEKVS